MLKPDSRSPDNHTLDAIQGVLGFYGAPKRDHPGESTAIFQFALED